MFLSISKKLGDLTFGITHILQKCQLFLFCHVRPANKPTITGVTLCH